MRRGDETIGLAAVGALDDDEAVALRAADDAPWERVRAVLRAAGRGVVLARDGAAAVAVAAPPVTAVVNVHPGRYASGERRFADLDEVRAFLLAVRDVARRTGRRVAGEIRAARDAPHERVLRLLAAFEEAGIVTVGVHRHTVPGTR
jgi:biopolymer transport protein ExbD